MEQIKLTVTVDDDHVDATESIAAALATEGFEVHRIVPDAGAIFGSADDEIVGRLRQLDGVLEVRPSRIYQVPPFDKRFPQ